MDATLVAARPTRADLHVHHLTARPVTVRPMTRRWISDVPSKMVKILGADFQWLVRRVRAGKSPCGGRVPRHSTTGNDSIRRVLLHTVLPAGAVR